MLEKSQCWYKLNWEQETVIEHDKVKLCWDFEYRMGKETTARRPDVTIESKDRTLIRIINMPCYSDQNINEKVTEKLQKYQKLDFEIKEKRQGFHVEIIPVVTACMREQIAKVLVPDAKKMTRTWREMLQTALAESENIIRKLLSNFLTAV